MSKIPKAPRVSTTECIVCNTQTWLSPMCDYHLRTCLGLEVKQTSLKNRKTGIPFIFNGLFSTIDREKNNIICKYTGRIISNTDNEANDSIYIIESGQPGYSIDGHGSTTCVAALANCIYRQSRKPNAEYRIVNNALFPVMYSIRRINYGDEILVDYGSKYWETE